MGPHHTDGPCLSIFLVHRRRGPRRGSSTVCLDDIKGSASTRPNLLHTAGAPCHSAHIVRTPCQWFPGVPFCDVAHSRRPSADSNLFLCGGPDLSSCAATLAVE